MVARLNVGEKKRGKNNSDMANPGKKSENDGGGGGGELGRIFLLLKLKIGV